MVNISSFEIPTPQRRCHQIIQNGERCSNFTFITKYNCNEHPLTEEEIPNCLICTEPEPEITICGHFVHSECIVASGKPMCPFCRNIARLTPDQHERCMEVMRRYQEEQIEEERQEILRDENDQNARVDALEILFRMLPMDRLAELNARLTTALARRGMLTIPDWTSPNYPSILQHLRQQQPNANHPEVLRNLMLSEIGNLRERLENMEQIMQNHRLVLHPSNSVENPTGPTESEAIDSLFHYTGEDLFNFSTDEDTDFDEDELDTIID